MDEAIADERRMNGFSNILRRIEDMEELKEIESKMWDVKEIRVKIRNYEEEEKEEIEFKITDYLERKERPELRGMYYLEKKPLEKMYLKVSTELWRRVEERRQEKRKKMGKIRLKSLRKTGEGHVIILGKRLNGQKFWKRKEKVEFFVAKEKLEEQKVRPTIMKELGFEQKERFRLLIEQE